MSAVRRYLLYCDHPDCSDMSPIEGRPGETLGAIRISARRVGWRRGRKGGWDYCELHTGSPSRTGGDPS